uniref:N-acetyltransferase ESCO zinc-finger domain-containing protein n=1 Tax=Brassica campestris TaxID=3711 RepID=M4E5F6_BRACM
MQAKINSFFKPSASSPSPIADDVSATTPDADDGLAAWEKSRNVIVNTYERRSATVDRSEVLKGCMGNPPLRKGSSFGSKNLSKKRSYTQFHLELGQSDFLLRHCAECGATYAPGDELDEKNHQSFHKDYMYGIPFKGWQNERVFASPSFNKNRIVMVLLENDSPAHRNKVQEVVKMMEVELGEGWILHKHCKHNAYDNALSIGLKSCVDLCGARSTSGKQSNSLPIETSNQPSDTTQEQHLVSLLNFRAAMEVNPSQLGEDWPLLRERLLMRSFEEV